YGESTEGARRGRSSARGGGRGSVGTQGRRLPAAGDAFQPDCRNAGRVQCADGPLQSADRRVCRLNAGLLRRLAGSKETRGREESRRTREEASHRHPPFRSAEAEMGTIALSSTGGRGL